MRPLFAFLLTIFPTMMALAQYPTIPDSVKQRGAEQEALWEKQDREAWLKAMPAVMDGMMHGKPFVPWCNAPAMLPQAISKHCAVG